MPERFTVRFRHRLLALARRAGRKLPAPLRSPLRKIWRTAFKAQEWVAATIETPRPVDLSPAAQLAARFPDLAPLPVFASPRGDKRRLTVVTDSVSAGSLYGGVGTSLILAALTARRIGAGLRLVTRHEPATASSVGTVLEAHGIPWTGSIECLFAPHDGVPGGRDIPMTSEDLFLTTSWWTTRSTRQTVPSRRIACLVQEDERKFYPLGDDYLRCTETLSDSALVYLVNSNVLLTELEEEGLVPGGIAFEPSFPAHLYHANERPPAGGKGKRGFFFYARPLNLRNLYWRGLEALSAAIEEGVLDPAEWDFHFAGHGAEVPHLPLGATAIVPGPMHWRDYAAFVRRMDIGLSLMYSPHPSYPPLDLAASGAVVVTNRFGRKRDLNQYSENILCADLDVPSLVSALRAAVVLANDRPRLAMNMARAGLQRDWSVSMAPAVDRLAVWAGS